MNTSDTCPRSILTPERPNDTSYEAIVKIMGDDWNARGFCIGVKSGGDPAALGYEFPTEKRRRLVDWALRMELHFAPSPHPRTERGVTFHVGNPKNRARTPVFDVWPEAMGEAVIFADSGRPITLGYSKPYGSDWPHTWITE
jgi:hypothetical protein